MPDPTIPTINLKDLESFISNTKQTNNPQQETYTPRSIHNQGTSQYDKNFIIPETTNTGDTPEMELANYRGYIQPKIDKWGNAVFRLVSKVGLEIAKTPGYIGAGLEALTPGKALAETLDNGYLNMLDNAEEKVKEQFAIHKPKWVREGNLWDNMSSASFWTDEGVDGAGFMISMFAPGAAAKSLNLASKISKVGAASKLAKGFGTTAQAIGRNAELGAVTLVNSSLEAMAEAKGVSDELKKSLTGKVNPIRADLEDTLNPLTGRFYTKEDTYYTEEEINKIRGEAASGVFKTNMAILMIPNAIMNKQLLGRFSGTRAALNEVMDVTNPIAKNSVIKDYLKAAGKTMVSEGFGEEGMQEATTNYYKNKVTGKTDKGWLAGIANEYADMLGTTEGQKAVFLGAVLGGGSSIAFHGKELKAEKAYKNQVSELLNKNLTSLAINQDIFEKDNDGNIIKEEDPETGVLKPKIDITKAKKFFGAIVGANNDNIIQQLAAALNDEDTFEQVFNKNFIDWVLPHLGVENGIELVNRQIDNLSKEASELFGESREDFDENAFKQKLKSNVKELTSTYNSLIDYTDNVASVLPKDDPTTVESFIRDIHQAAIVETGKQMFLNNKIAELNKEHIELANSANAELPQNQKILKDIEKRTIEHGNKLDKSKEKYNALFDNSKVLEAYETYKSDKKKEEDYIENIKANQAWKAGETLTEEQQATRDKNPEAILENELENKILAVASNDNTYSNWSDIKDGSDRQLFDKELTDVISTFKDMDNVSELSKEEIEALLPTKAFSDPEINKVVANLIYEHFKNKIADPEVISDPNAIEVINPEIKKSDYDASTAKKDISYYFRTTIGRDEKDSPFEDQIRWFNVTSKLRGTDVTGFTLKLIHIDSDYGDKKDIRFYDKTDIKAVLYKDDQPYYSEGKLVYTSIPLSMTLQEVETSGRVTNKGTSTTEPLTPEKIQNKINNYNKFRGDILSSKTPIDVQVTETTRGVINWEALPRDTNGNVLYKMPVTGKLVTSNDDIDSIKIEIARFNSVVIDTDVYDVTPGMVYLVKDGKLTPARVSKLSEIDGAVDTVIKLIKELSLVETTGKESTSGRGYKQIIDDLNSIILWGKFDNKTHPFQIYLKKDHKTLVYNGKSHDISDELSLRKFLNEKYFRVNLGLLNKNGEFISPITKVKYPSYKHYLLSDKDRSASQVPLGVGLGELGIKQYNSVGLKFIPPASKIDDGVVLTSNSEVESSEKYNPFTDFGKDVTNTDIPYDENTGEVKEDIEETKDYSNEDKLDATRNSSEEPFLLNDTEFVPADKAQLDLEEKWFKDNFPNIDYKRVKGLIDRKAVGKFLSSGTILVSDSAPIGTTYHEAFHVVFRLYLTDKEREAMYKDYTKRTGKTMSKLAIEEAMAEEFRAFKNGDRTGYTPMQKSFFRKLLDLIRSMLGLSTDNTNDLYNRIDKGYYKASNPVVDKTSKAVAYMEAPGKDTFWTSQFMESANVYFFNELFRAKEGSYDIESIFDEKAKHLPDIYKKVYDRFKARMSGNPVFAADFKYINTNWNKMVSMHAEYLKRYGLEIGLKFNGEDLADNELANKHIEENIGEEEIISRDNAYIDYIHYSSKDQMSRVVKMLLASLPKQKYINGEVKTELTIFNTPRNVSFDSIIAYLGDKLAGVQDMNQLVARLEALSIHRPELKIMMSYLNIDSANPFAKTLTDVQARLVVKFFQQFSATKENFKSMIFSPEEKTMRLVDSNAARVSNIVRNKWENAQKESINKADDLYMMVDGRIILNPTKFNDIIAESNEKDFKSVIKALEKLGIVFTQKDWNKDIHGSDMGTILREFITIKDVITKNPGTTNIFQKGVIGGPLDKLIEVELKYNKEAIDLQHINPEGKSVYGINKNSYLSLIVNQIANQGISSLEHLNPANNLNTVDSVWYDLLNKGKTKLEMHILEGMNTDESGSEGTITSELDMGDLLALSLNSILNTVEGPGGLVSKSYFPLLRAADGKLERSFQIDFDMNREEFINQMIKYYTTDLIKSKALIVDGLGSDILHYNEQAKISPVFSNMANMPIPVINEIFNPEVFVNDNRGKIVNAINGWFETQVADIKYKLLEYNVVDKQHGTDDIIINAIDPKVVKRITGRTIQASQTFINEAGKEETTPEKRNITQSEFKAILSELLIKNTISNIEQSKLLLGDLSFYEIEKGGVGKRTKGSTGPKKLPLTDPSYNVWLDTNNPRLDGKPQNGKIRSIVYADVKVISEYFDIYKDAIKDKANDYANINEADAQGIITLPAYKEFMLRIGDWTPAQERLFNNLTKGIKISKDDLALFPCIKPQYFGPQSYKGLYVPTYYKFSLMPLIPQVIEALGNSNLSILNKHMQDNHIDISMFESANKVGHKLQDGKKVTFYNTDGSLNTNNNTVIETDFKYMGIQVDNAPVEKKKVTTGTQWRKLQLSNLFIYGNPKPIRVINARTGKLDESRNTETIRNEYNEAVNNITLLERNKLEKRLTLSKNNEGNYIIGDIKIFEDILIKESEDREVANNIIESIRYGLEGEHKAIDFTLNKAKIESLLNSLVNNKVIKQKTSGDMKIQAASTGFEVGARKFNDKDKMLGNAPLKFYRKGDQGETLAMQVLLPNFMKELYGKNVDIKTLQPELLKIIGFRIPTDKMSAIDSIEIVGFLPEEAGNMIVMPSEITVKNGSDYDVDKLTVYVPNYIMLSGKPVYLPTEDKELKKVYDRWRKGALDTIKSIELDNKLKEKEVAQVNKLKLSQEHKDFLLSMFDNELDLSETLEEAKTKAEISFEEFKEKHAIKLNQNRLIELSREILSSPDMFNDLITPNSVEVLKKLAADVKKLRNPNDTKTTGLKVIQYLDNLNLARSNWVGKNGVAITAKHNTSHVLAQQANLEVGDVNAYINFKYNSSRTLEFQEETKQGVINKKINVISLAGEYDANGKHKITDIIAQFLNAFVDIAKEPFIFELNASTATTNVWFYLIRAGVPVETIANFMAQPIIWDYLVARGKNESKTNPTIESKQDIVDRIKNLYNKGGSISSTSKVDYTSKMQGWIGKKEGNSEFHAAQLQLLDDFLHYEEQGKDLTELQKYTSTDTKGLGKNRLEARNDYKKLIEVIESGKFFNADKIVSDTILKEFVETLKEGKDYYNSIFLSDDSRVREVLDVLEARFENAGYLSETISELMHLAENEMISYLLQTTVVDNTTLAGNIDKFFYPTSGKTLAQEVLKAKKLPVLKDNKFIQELFPIIVSNSTTHNIKKFSRKLNSYDTNILTDSFSDLYSVNPTLAMNLVKFTILQSGITNSPISFSNIVPAKLSNSIASPIVNKFFESNHVDLESFLDLFYMNNYNNGKLGKRVAFKMTNKQFQLTSYSNGILTVPEKGNLKNHYALSISKNVGTKSEPKYENRLFLLREGLTYQEVIPRGNGMYLHDYSLNNLLLKEENTIFAGSPSPDVSNDLNLDRIKEGFDVIAKSNLNDSQKAMFRDLLRNAKTNKDLDFVSRSLHEEIAKNLPDDVNPCKK